MPREIVTVQVGQCGNQMGLKWWDLMNQEHKHQQQQQVGGRRGVGQQQQHDLYDDSRSSLFYESNDGAMKARCIPIDMEEGVLNSMMKGPLRSLFDTTHFVSDVSGAGNNWAVGHMEFGDKYIEPIMDSVRLMVEKCNSLQTFVVMHSLSGGTGSGLGTRVLGGLEEDYPHVFRFCNVVMPAEVNDVVIAPYNSCFALREIIEHADCVLPLDNDALATMAEKATGGENNKGSSSSQASSSPSTDQKFNAAMPTKTKKLPFDTMNAIAAQMISNLTASMRFPGSLNMDINEITTNLVPYSRLLFLTSSIAPLNVSNHIMTGAKNVDAMFSSCLENSHQLVNCNPRRSTYLASALIARGKDLTITDLTRNVQRLKDKMRMVYWNADGFKTSLCSVPPLGHPQSLLMLSNNCGIASKLEALQDQFMKLYSVRSHVHHYEEYLELPFFDATMDIVGGVVDDYNFLNTVNDTSAKKAPRTMRDFVYI